MTTDAARDMLILISVASGAVLGAAGVLGLAYRLTFMRRLERLEAVLRAVEYHLAPNGHEGEAHPDDRGLPMRTLVMRTARVVRWIQQDLDGGSAWMQSHTTAHIRREAGWRQGD